MGKERRANYSGLAPTKGWPARNYKFFRHRIFPQMIRNPKGVTKMPITDAPEKGTARITWIGHASFYLQFHDCSLLIDPVWGTWLGIVKRQQMPGLCLDSMPSVDAVLISHAHIDHLHRHTLRQLTSSGGIIAPTGNGELVKGLGFDKIQEVKVWDELEVAGMKITHTPSHHWGARFGTDTHRDYGGYMIEYDGMSIYHAGDSAYFEGFSQIRERFGNTIDVAILPIGGYDAPSGRNVHLSPEEALQAFSDLNAKMMIPMHYDTYPLANEAVGEAKARLLKEAEALSMMDQIQILEAGEPFICHA